MSTCKPAAAASGARSSGSEVRIQSPSAASRTTAATRQKLALEQRRKLASLDVLERERTVERLSAIGARIHARLADLAAAPNVRGLRRLGGMVALDLEVGAGDRPGYLSKLGLRLRRAAVDRGVLLRPLGNVLYALPPACTTDAEADLIADVMRALCAEVARGLTPTPPSPHDRP